MGILHFSGRLLFICLCFGAISLLALAQAQAQEKQPQRVVVLGFDGADPVWVNQWIQEGKLPQLARLAALGSFVPLATTNPAESPVAWATFATGKNPGKHGIFGFLKRNPQKYRPELALAKVQKRPFLGGSLGKAALALALGLLIGGLGYGLLSVPWLCKVVANWSGRRFASGRMRMAGAAVTSLVVAAGVMYVLLHYFPQTIPYPVAVKHGTSLWTLAGQAGIKTVVLGAPMAFPAEEVPGGKLLCGLGVPDMAGTNGLWFRYSTQFAGITSTETGGWKMQLTPRHSPLADHQADVLPSPSTTGQWRGIILGPPNPLSREEEERLRERLPDADWQTRRHLQNRLAAIERHRYLHADLALTVLGAAGKLRIQIGTQVQDCRAEAWSDWFTVPFDLNPLLRLQGMVKAFVFSTDPPELYLSPVQFHPQHLPPNVAISYPRQFAAQLADQIGLYPTLGWATATNSLKDEQLTEEAFWQDISYMMATDTKKLWAQFNEKEWQLLLAFFYEPDRANHLYYRFMDHQNPRHAADMDQHARYQDKLLQVYQWMDTLVGQVLDRLGPDDILLVISDHGCAPFRYEVNLNRWLHEQGYLVLQPNVDWTHRAQVVDLFEPQRLVQNRFDWPKSQAYALGLGEIYINLQGREAQGIVSPQEYPRLCAKIRQQLLQLSYAGQPVVSQVYLRDEIYQGPYRHDSGDLIVGFARGYRVSWQNTLGNVATEVTSPNLLKWSGDHCTVEPQQVPGILLINRKLLTKNPALPDLAPTLLGFFHIPAPLDMDGQKIQVADGK